MQKVLPNVKPVRVPLDHAVHRVPYAIPFLPYVAPHGGKDAWGWVVDGRQSLDATGAGSGNTLQSGFTGGVFRKHRLLFEIEYSTRDSYPVQSIALAQGVCQFGRDSAFNILSPGLLGIQTLRTENFLKI